jgi:hypothetical protein
MSMILSEEQLVKALNSKCRSYFENGVVIVQIINKQKNLSLEIVCVSKANKNFYLLKDLHLLKNSTLWKERH